jgi:hypothetical protein
LFDTAIDGDGDDGTLTADEFVSTLRLMSDFFRSNNPPALAAVGMHSPSMAYTREEELWLGTQFDLIEQVCDCYYYLFLKHFWGHINAFISQMDTNNAHMWSTPLKKKDLRVSTEEN